MFEVILIVEHHLIIQYNKSNMFFHKHLEIYLWNILIYISKLILSSFEVIILSRFNKMAVKCQIFT